MDSLVTTEWLAQHLNYEDLVVADIRWVHLNSEAARAEYKSGHIPGAVFVDCDQVLSEIGDPRRGRHPLPDPNRMVQKLAEIGIGKGKRVVAVETDPGKVAARLWWLLQWIGVKDVAILDGGLRKWVAEGRAIATGEERRPACEPYEVSVRSDLMRNAKEVAAGQSGRVLLDARIPARFQGEIEPLDKRAGSIDGAGNLPLGLLHDGEPAKLKTTEELRELFRANGLSPDAEITTYCGSGVTACHLLWALERAGYTKLSLYPGSWSEWIELHEDAGKRLT
ncbi:MAG: sulfurtransferase [Calditrichaeota bacterium]|nr:sulfurtransferase [Calditrichota bacterium]